MGRAQWRNHAPCRQGGSDARSFVAALQDGGTHEIVSAYDHGNQANHIAMSVTASAACCLLGSVKQFSIPTAGEGLSCCVAALHSAQPAMMMAQRRLRDWYDHPTVRARLKPLQPVFPKRTY